MNSLIIVLLLALKVHSIQSDDCGLTSNSFNGNRIVGGREALKGEFPWMASLQSKSRFSEGYHHFCGATILNRKWVLTAAHCLDSLQPGSIRVVAGAHNVHIWTAGMSIHNAQQFVIHRNFAENSPLDDIALISLKEEIDFESSNRLSNSVCLPESDHYLKGLATATGWGQVSEKGSSSPLLLAVELPITTQEYCKRKYGYNVIKDTVFCAGSVEGVDTCLGDSGGPVVQVINNRAVLVGIVSFGGRECGQNGWPAVYTEVSKYLQWIHNIIN